MCTVLSKNSPPSASFHASVSFSWCKPSRHLVQKLCRHASSRGSTSSFLQMRQSHSFTLLFLTSYAEVLGATSKFWLTGRREPFAWSGLLPALNESCSKDFLLSCFLRVKLPKIYKRRSTSIFK